MMTTNTDVMIIGAGPAGSAAGALLASRGRSAICLERSWFPRHVIGESLLPRTDALLDEIGMLEAVRARGYMVKKGAVFLHEGRSERFCLENGLEGDRPETLQVPREDFDQVLATEARSKGLDLRFGQEVTGVDFRDDGAIVSVVDLENDRRYEVHAKFVLDCSGYGRVLPRLLDLEREPALPQRVSCYTQVEGDRRPSGELEGDVWICSHPDNGWLWIIPFSNGRTSVGSVCDPDYWAKLPGNDREKLWAYMRSDPAAWERLSSAVPVAKTTAIHGYSRKVSALHGDRWALVGNATDFLDPVFSSGVTLALETAVLAAKLVDRALGGESVEWDDEYDAPIGKAVGVFLAFIESWYRGELIDIFFDDRRTPEIKRQITSILGGHVLRDDNPFTGDASGELRKLHDRVRAGRAQQPVAE